MEEWKEYKLGNVLTIKYGKDHKQIADGDIPIYVSGGIMRYGERSPVRWFFNSYSEKR
jgi:type I restriction enzyme S subunit